MHDQLQVLILPAATAALDLEPDNPGLWMFHCHVSIRKNQYKETLEDKSCAPALHHPQLSHSFPLVTSVAPSQVNTHLTQGMVDRFSVTGPEPPSLAAMASAGNSSEAVTIRSYFIAADEVEWNYAPLNGSACSEDGTIAPFEEGSEAATYLGEPNGKRIGSRLAA